MQISRWRQLIKVNVRAVDAADSVNGFLRFLQPARQMVQEHCWSPECFLLASCWRDACSNEQFHEVGYLL
jgi:hypothetical protein